MRHCLRPFCNVSKGSASWGLCGDLMGNPHARTLAVVFSRSNTVN